MTVPDLKQLRVVLAFAGAALLLPLPLPVPRATASLFAQAYPGRLRRPPVIPPDAQPAPQNSAPPATPAPPPAPTTVAPAAQAAPAAPATLPPSMLQDPAKPAQVEFADGSLSIDADNSNLGDILRAISSKSGMQLRGFGQDERVFGKFGPGDPRSVLADLLNGTPYNLLMVGDMSNGAPRQLLLTPANRTSASAPVASPVGQKPEDEADNSVEQTPPQPIPAPQSEQRGPTGPNSQAIKTPQQLFQELQSMRQQREQAQQPQQ